MPQTALREAMRIVAGRAGLLDRHLARLAAGGCAGRTLDEARSAVQREAGGWPKSLGRLALLVSPSGTISVEVEEYRSALEVPGGPVPVVVHTDFPTLPHGAAKPADRSFWDRAHEASASHGGDVAILVGPDGHVVDGSVASVWVRIGERLFTPPAPFAVAGVARGLVLDAAPALGYSAEEALITERHLDAADELFFTNAVAGVVPARARGGEAVERLRGIFGEVFGA